MEGHVGQFCQLSRLLDKLGSQRSQHRQLSQLSWLSQGWSLCVRMAVTGMVFVTPNKQTKTENKWPEGNLHIEILEIYETLDM